MFGVVDGNQCQQSAIWFRPADTVQGDFLSIKRVHPNILIHALMLQPDRVGRL